MHRTWSEKATPSNDWRSPTSSSTCRVPARKPHSSKRSKKQVRGRTTPRNERTSAKREVKTRTTCKETVLTRRTKRRIRVRNATDVVNKFKATRWGQKLAAREAKANTSDFDRYKLMVQRMKKSAAMKRELAKLKKQAA
mmetsp:Transcript_2403/g.16144  ORF Transcript_2403/g.16144 Transcript_2403/m.16144 type:complete len:139 (-) Transcript_2403:82-498(-)